jgi:hypothetical protein
VWQSHAQNAIEKTVKPTIFSGDSPKDSIMSFDEREKAFENKFAHDQQLKFRIEARASKLIGLWAAEQMGMNAEDAKNYANDVVVSNLDEPGFNDVRRKIVADFAAHGMEAEPDFLNGIIAKKIEEAEQQVMAEAKK